MTDIPEFPNRYDRNFKSNHVESDAPRAMLPIHSVVEDGRRINVIPAFSLVLGMVMDAAGGQMPVMRVAAHGAPMALSYIFMPEELRWLGKAMLEQADEMEARTVGAFEDLMARAKKGGTPD